MWAEKLPVGEWDIVLDGFIVHILPMRNKTQRRLGDFLISQKSCFFHWTMLPLTNCPSPLSEWGNRGASRTGLSPFKEASGWLSLESERNRLCTSEWWSLVCTRQSFMSLPGWPRLTYTPACDVACRCWGVPGDCGKALWQLILAVLFLLLSATRRGKLWR